MIKLYTEEQVRVVYNLGFSDANNNFGRKEDETINFLTPIELPSDEEIQDKGKWIFNNDGHTVFTHYNTVPSWIKGAEWMKEQILNQNK